jgi:hypothetical protein
MSGFVVQPIASMQVNIPLGTTVNMGHKAYSKKKEGALFVIG